MMHEGAASWCRLHALTLTMQQEGTERHFHISNACACRSDCQMYAFGTTSNAPGLDHVQEQAQVAEIETRHAMSLRIWRKSLAQNADCVVLRARPDFVKYERRAS